MFKEYELNFFNKDNSNELDFNKIVENNVVENKNLLKSNVNTFNKFIKVFDDFNIKYTIKINDLVYNNNYIDIELFKNSFNDNIFRLFVLNKDNILSFINLNDIDFIIFDDYDNIIIYSNNENIDNINFNMNNIKCLKILKINDYYKKYKDMDSRFIIFDDNFNNNDFLDKYYLNDNLINDLCNDFYIDYVTLDIELLSMLHNIKEYENVIVDNFLKGLI